MEYDTPVTIFICNIATSLPDSFIKRVLDQCGKVNRWRRALGVKDEPYDFAFVDFLTTNDTLRALRVIPQIVILEKRWSATVDKEKRYDLDAYESSLKMKPDYDRQKEHRKDQTIVHMINQIVESSAFAKSVERLTEVLHSEFDDDRNGEHYKYKKEVRDENDRYEQIFRANLIDWRKTEIQYNNESKQMKKSEKKSEESINRESFLENWKKPKFDLGDGKEEYLSQWNKFLEYRKQRRQIRQNELKLEELIKQETSP
ncbi:putative RNA-binding protein 25 [Tritrichomonas musculus]|uniref:RNA-binding protein 25 n=1 Tax=Tritrichomonas musculus TaxID=1915356 RepID=A0ABR2IDP8_9EUKA